MSIISANLTGNLSYLDQDKTDNTKPLDLTSVVTTSVESLSPTNLEENDSKNSSSSISNKAQSSSLKDDDTLDKDLQFTASFQKSQLLSKLPNDKDIANQQDSVQKTSTTSTASAANELGDYGHLSTGQKRLVDDLTSRQNAANKTNLSPAEFYNKLEPSQKSTFESITNALENTTVISKDGKKTNALDTIETVDVILGEKQGSTDGKEQFRLFVTLKDGAGNNIRTAKNFENVPGHGENYKHGRQLSGGEPSIQISVSPDGKKADIDVDYESKNPVTNLFNGFKHLKPSNSDVRHADHFEKHNKKFASEAGQQPLIKKY
ncbi:MAG: hypothetical protein HY819_11160 [Acidobacteria bacterium]|nr:hypothetical protein [Acidobacteriota bacterium]